jgi:hypothetical protein
MWAFAIFVAVYHLLVQYYNYRMHNKINFLMQISSTLLILILFFFFALQYNFNNFKNRLKINKTFIFKFKWMHEITGSLLVSLFILADNISTDVYFPRCLFKRKWKIEIFTKKF